MKLILIFVFFFLKICYGNEDKEAKFNSWIEQEQAIAKVRSSALQCKLEGFGTERDVRDVFNHKTSTTYQGDCFRMCIAQKMDMMDPNGNPNKEGFLKGIEIFSGGDPREIKIGKEIIEDLMLQTCPSDPCERGAFWDYYLRTKAKQRRIKLFYTWDACESTN